MAASTKPKRGEVWWIDFEPTVGAEQQGKRPAVIVSVDRFNEGATMRVTVCPITGHPTRTPLHVAVPAGTGGMKVESSVLIEQVRTVSLERLDPISAGRLTPEMMVAVSNSLRTLLGL